MARENPAWGYDRIAGALANLGHRVSDQTVGNVLGRHGILPAPERKHTTSWADFIRAHRAVLAATDFFTVEVITLRGLVTCYVLFFIQLESRRVEIAEITRHPDAIWMRQMARNVTMEGWGFLGDSRYLIHDRDTKLIMPSEWMRWVWDMESGERVREFRSEKETQRILSLLMRHANDIATP